MSLNKAMIIGHLGKDPEVRAAGGSTVANFNVATSESWVDKQGQKQEKTEWHRIQIWGKAADFCGKYLKKGSKVYVEGKIQTRKFTNKEGKDQYVTEIVSQSIQGLDRRTDGGGAAPAPDSNPFSGSGSSAPSTPPASEPGFTDDIPF